MINVFGNKGMFVVLLTFLLFSSFVMADENILFKLSSESNAHGANYSYEGYDFEVNYDKIFGENYTGSNVHECDGTNEVIRLNSETNAHAEIPYGGGYDYVLCYGNLSCEVEDVGGGSSCSNGSEMVVRVSDLLNAHISSVSSGEDYAFAICCFDNSEREIPIELEESYYWADAEGTNLSLAYDGDDVKAIINTGISMANINLEIYEADLLFDDIILTGINLSADERGYAEYNWTINISELDEEFDEEFEVYFKVEFEGVDGSVTRISDELIIDVRGTAIIVDACNAFYLGEDNREEYIEYCDDYNRVEGNDLDKEGQCNADCNEVYETEIDVNGGATGTEIESGECVWRSEKCRFEYTTGEPEANPLVCTQTAEFGNCVEGYRAVKYRYTKTSGTGSCPDEQTMRIPCPKSIELPFFGWIGLIISIAIIAAIYLNQMKRNKIK